ncbi:energy transducer TonB [Dyadobacter fermentans]|uniref:energy transducer TonB n=1 Tax=Dyadobacter fermentans TaxID=94254 RepID=UPI00019B57F4|nr:energy transducer TonB [Dyadobacter fermentans]
MKINALIFCVLLIATIGKATGQPAEQLLENAQASNQKNWIDRNESWTKNTPIQDEDVVIARQLSAMMRYPTTLEAANISGVVMVKIDVGRSGTITHVKIFSQEEDLNNDISRQLLGKRLQVVRPASHAQSYLFKFVFKSHE